ncbi:MAG: hypothetical protein M3R69_11860, partial [Acidobacteriota bacterium]|nr:hypothetical protein [Acidobacteriota bacterium]
MAESASIGNIPIVVRLGVSTLWPRRRKDVELLSKYISMFAQELIHDLAIPARARVSVQDAGSGISFLVSINDESCRMRRHVGKDRLNAKKLAVEIADVLLQN